MEAQYDSVYGIPVSWASMVEKYEHTPIIARFGSLIERVWISGQRVKALYGPGVKVPWKDVPVRLWGSIAPLGAESGVSSGSCSSTSEESTG